MPIEVKPLIRTFAYKGMTLDDPNPNAPVEQVRDILAIQHPELATAGIKGPTPQGDALEYKFEIALGDKG